MIANHEHNSTRTKRMKAKKEVRVKENDVVRACSM